jgi:hypothetical protein
VSKRPRGALPGWQPRTPRQAGILADLLARYQQHQREDTLPRSGRGMFYDLRPHGLGNGITYTKRPGVLDPMEARPEHVQEVLVLARRAGLIPEGWVADARAPQPLTDSYYAGADDFAAAVARAAEGFQLDPQRDQAIYVEVWCEAEDLAPRLARVARPYGVPVYSGGGYGGLKGRRQLAARATDREVPTVVLVVTDLDPDGLRIFNSAAEDAAAWVEHEDPLAPADWLTFDRIAVSPSQAEAAGVLDDDGKAEADALPVPVMDAILRGRLDQLTDPAARESVRVEQDRERGRLAAATSAALGDVAS